MIIKHLLSKSFSRRINYPKLHLFYAVISNKLRTFVPVSISPKIRKQSQWQSQLQ